MKQLLSLLLVIAAVFSMIAVLPVQAAAQTGDMLTITSKGEALATVPVGSVFVFHVRLNSAGYNPQTGQGYLRYDSSHVELVEYGSVRTDGTIYRDAYSFPAAIRNSSLITNYTGEEGQILYSFARYSGIGVFDESKRYMRVRFKATAPGTAEIRHFMTRLYTTVDNQYIRLIYNNVGNDQLDDIPYTVSAVETAAGYVGDADDDGDISVIDATVIQRVVAGENRPYNRLSADVNGDGSVTILDATALMRYKVGMSHEGEIGNPIFASEV